MMHRFGRKFDKENNLEIEYTTSKTPPTNKTALTASNYQLRKKMDESLAAIERSNGSGKQREQSTSTSRCKRQRAKNQEFNRKVSTIASINQKITSLLNIVKKDKAQRIDTTVAQQQKNDQPIVGLKQARKQFTLVSPFTKNKANFSRQDYYNLNDSITDDPTTRIVSSSQYESLKDMQLMQLRKKYLPEPSSNNINQKSYKNHSSFSIQQEIGENKGKISDYLSRIVERGESEVSFTTQKRNIDEIIEDRKVRRDDRQERRQQFQKQITQQQSFFKSNFTSQTQKTQNKTPIIFETSTQEGDKNYKIQSTNSTTRLIDQQIKRIKSKIENSQSCTQINQIDFLSKNNSRKMSRIISQKQYINTVTTKLSIQVDYDNLLRPARMAFDKILGEQKWDNFHQQLKSNGMKISSQFIKELMRVTADQHNPFSEDKQEDTTDVIDLFIRAQKNWENEVCGCITVQQMKAGKFSPSQIDLTRKGCLSVEDIVCFVNLNTGSFYRNRDLALVFRRFQLVAGETGSNITFKAFQKALTT